MNGNIKMYLLISSMVWTENNGEASLINFSGNMALQQKQKVFASMNYRMTLFESIKQNMYRRKMVTGWTVKTRKKRI